MCEALQPGHRTANGSRLRRFATASRVSSRSGRPASEPPIALGDDYALDPAWSPSGRFLVYTGRDVGTVLPIRAVNADGTPRRVPELFLHRGSRRLDFLGGDDRSLVILKGALSQKEFWVWMSRAALNAR